MSSTILHIKNMICDRCIRVVREELEQLGHPVLDIALGSVTIKGPISKALIRKIDGVMKHCGFELIQNEKQRSVEMVKHLVIDHLHNRKEKPEHQNFSDYLAHKTGVRYRNLSKMFSKQEGITIQRYLILQKTERAKELLSYNELSLADIAFDLGYSSIAHFSSQFKSVAGVSPITFKREKRPPRNPLDQIP